MAPTNKNKDEYGSRREKVKQNMRNMRERIRNDPVKYEEYKRKERERYEKRKKEGKIKKINDLTDREKRQKRKAWKYCSKKYRETCRRVQNVLNITPPASPQVADPTQPPHETPTSRQYEQGKRQSRKYRRKLHGTIKKLEATNETLRRRVQKYKKRCSRYKKANKKTANPDSPTSKVNALLENKENDVEKIRKKVLFGEVVKKQIEENLYGEKSLEGKRTILKAVSGNVMKKYQFLNVLHTLSPKLCRPKRPLNNKKIKKGLLQKTIQDFLERDECSRMQPGKKDTITKSKTKRQRRFLSDSLKNLHVKFIQTYPEYKKISYTHFCKYRPFWVLLPNVRSRETCACIHHENMALITRKLKILNIINSTFPDQLCKELCCEEKLNEICLSRTCDLCKEKEFLLKDFDPDDTIICKLWTNRKEKIIVKGIEKICQKTVKEIITFTASKLVTKLKEDLPKYMLHLRNIIHQYKVINDVKNNLADNEILTHMDFSENYNCKYGREVQSTHFGGSKPQVSLHTVIVYHKENEKTINTNYCTLSESLRHDPPAICAHLEPVFFKTKTQIGKVKTAHFLSDGPTTQYKNKKMFYLIASQIAKTLEVEQIQWHYSESGHGKGAPDGIGGAVKRTADSSVSYGKDVSSFDALFSILKEKCKKINILSISEADICKFGHVIPDKLNAFKGTLKIRQIFWHNGEPNALYFRYLSCLQCIGSCEHYHLGSIKIENHLNVDYEARPSTSTRLRYVDVYSSDEDEVMQEVTGQKFLIADGSFVIVKFLGKKRIKYYIGKILSEAENDKLLLISFMRRKNKSNKFVFPNESDIYPVPKKDIVLILKAPEERRNQYYFDQSEIKNYEHLE